MFILQPEDVLRLKLIGEGAFGKVYYGKLRNRRLNTHSNIVSVAIKDIPLTHLDMDEKKDELINKIKFSTRN